MTLMLASMASYDHKSHVMPHFDCLNIRNVMDPVTIPSPSCDANTGANGVI